MHNLKWFIDRIGKRVYRDHSCPCDACQRVEKEGIVIIDMEHAQYMNMISGDIGIEYRDKQ
jgi:hypothetical protein